MPELPEVETVRRGLEKLILWKNHPIRGSKVSKDDSDGSGCFSTRSPRSRNSGHGAPWEISLVLSDGSGPHLAFADGRQVFLLSRRSPSSQACPCLFHFTDGSTLVYEDVRKFGTMEVLVPELVDSYFLAKKIGPEPTEADFKEPAFRAALKQSKKPIKSALLDQKLVAGLGNIYVDEVLYRAKVHPAHLGQSLTVREAKAIRKETIAVLAQAVEKGGSTIRSYSNAFGEDGTMQEEHQVYGKTGQPCLRCGTPIEKIQLGGRGTHFCPHCQKEN